MSGTVQRNYGWRNSNPDHRDKVFAAPCVTLKDIDMRPRMAPVFDQGHTESCTGNASGAAFEYILQKDHLEIFRPSRLFIYYNGRLAGNTVDSPDAGATIRDVVASLVKYGAPSEADWPFDPNIVTQRPTDAVYSEAKNHVVKLYASVEQTLESIVAALDSDHPVVFGATLYDSFEGEDTAQTGIVTMPEPSENAVGGHALLIVGVNVAEQQFIVRNSWGAEWGDKGYCYFPFDYILNPNLADDFWVMTSISDYVK